MLKKVNTRTTPLGVGGSTCMVFQPQHTLVFFVARWCFVVDLEGLSVGGWLAVVHVWSKSW